MDGERTVGVVRADASFEGFKLLTWWPYYYLFFWKCVFDQRKFVSKPRHRQKQIV